MHNLGTGDWLIGSQHSCGHVLDGITLLFVGPYPLPVRLELVRLLDRFLDESADQIAGHFELLGHVFLKTVWLLCGTDNRCHLVRREILPVALLVPFDRSLVLNSTETEFLLRDALNIVFWN